MKMNIDKAISILQDYIKADREIREGSIEDDYNLFCENRCLAIESLIKYVYASRCAFKTSSVISKKVEGVEDKNITQFSEIDVKKILACLTNCVFVADDGCISEEQRLKLIDYNYDILYKICDSLGVTLDDIIIDINTLEIKDIFNS